MREILKCIFSLYMEASIVDLRYRMKDVLRALERNEEVTVLHRGAVKGTIVPKGVPHKARANKHPFFGSVLSTSHSVDEEIDELRSGRFRDL